MNKISYQQAVIEWATDATIQTANGNFYGLYQMNTYAVWVKWVDGTSKIRILPAGSVSQWPEFPPNYEFLDLLLEAMRRQENYFHYSEEPFIPTIEKPAYNPLAQFYADLLMKPKPIKWNSNDLPF